ncbi:metalloendopeptidase [Rhodosporidiobolus nylandii]
MHNAKALMQSPLFLVAVGGGGTYYVLHLEQVPETGRYRFMDVSPEMEKQMGDETLQQVLAECGGKILPDYHPQARHVQSVVKRIVQANGLEGSLGGKGFVTHVVKENQTKNAFVLPNGHIFVFTGILEVAQDSDGLAVVLGHEIAHQVARHSAERMSGTKVFYGLSLILGSLGVDFGVSRILLNLVMQLPNSRKNETEADLIGLRLANAACYDPRAAESLWQRMGAAEQAPGVDMSFLSTHPSSKNRTVKVREWAEEIIKDRPSECGPLRGQASAFQGLTGSRW